MIFKYKNLPIIPPPFIIISHVILLFKMCHKKRVENIESDDTSVDKKIEEEKLTDVQKHEDVNGM